MRIETKKLKNAVAYFKQIASAKDSLVSFKKKDNQLFITAGNEHFFTGISIECSSVIESSFFAHQLHSALKGVKSEYLDFDGLAFKANGTTVDGILCTDTQVTESAFSDLDYGDVFEVDQKTIKATLKRLSRSGGIVEGSPRRYGSVLYFDKDLVVGTDGYRLCYTYLNLEKLAGTCINSAQIKLICKLRAGTTNWSLSKDKTTLRIMSEATETYLVLPKVDYPKFQDILAESESKSNQKVRLENFKENLQNLLLSCDKTKAIRIDSNGLNLRFSTKTEAFEINGPGVLVDGLHINGKFLLDSLYNHKDDVHLGLCAAGANETRQIDPIEKNQAPIRLECGDFTTILVPIRVDYLPKIHFISKQRKIDWLAMQQRIMAKPI